LLRHYSSTSLGPPASGFAADNRPRTLFGDPEIFRRADFADASSSFMKPSRARATSWSSARKNLSTRRSQSQPDTRVRFPLIFWSRDGKYILFVQDKAGDENYLVYAVESGRCPAPARKFRRRET
jgi:hypothetical protein